MGLYGENHPAGDEAVNFRADRENKLVKPGIKLAEHNRRLAERATKQWDKNAEKSIPAPMQEAKDTTPDNMKANGTFFTRNEAGHKIESIEHARNEMNADLASRNIEEQKPEEGTPAADAEALQRSSEATTAEEKPVESATPSSENQHTGKPSFPGINISALRESGGKLTDVMSAEDIDRMFELDDKLANGEEFSQEERDELTQIRTQAKQKAEEWVKDKSEPEASDATTQSTAESQPAKEQTARSEYVSIHQLQREIRKAGESSDAVMAGGMGKEKLDRMWQLQEKFGGKSDSLSDAEWEELMSLKAEAVKAMDKWQNDKEATSSSANENDDIDIDLTPSATAVDNGDDLDIQLGWPEEGKPQVEAPTAAETTPSAEASTPENRNAREIGRERRMKLFGRLAGTFTRIGKFLDKTLDVAFAPKEASKEAGQNLRERYDGARKSVEGKVNNILNDHREKVQAKRDQRRSAREARSAQIKDDKLRAQIEKLEDRISKQEESVAEADNAWEQARENYRSDIDNANRCRSEAQVLRDRAEQMRASVVVREPRKNEAAPEPAEQPVEAPKTAPEAEDFVEMPTSEEPVAKNAVEESPEAKSAREVGAERRRWLGEKAKRVTETIVDNTLGVNVAARNALESGRRKIAEINKKTAEGVNKAVERGGEIRQDILNGIKNVGIKREAGRLLAEAGARDWSAKEFTASARGNTLDKMLHFSKMAENRRAALDKLRAQRDGLLAERGIKPEEEIPAAAETEGATSADAVA